MPKLERRLGLSLKLETRGPFAVEPIFQYLSARAIPGVEQITPAHYRRFVRLKGSAGWIEIAPAASGALSLHVDETLRAEQSDIVRRSRALFDLDARSDVIDEHLAQDPWLAPHVRRVPGLRVPGAFDAWELAVRAVLGQQISVPAATTLSGRLVQSFGERVPDLAGDLAWAFPSPAVLGALSSGEVQRIGLTRARAETLVALAQAVAAGAVDLSPETSPENVVSALKQVRGIGEWTARYVVLRAWHVADAFLSSDLGVRKALAVASASEAEQRSSAWQPFRAYAVLHLWSSIAKPEHSP